MLAPSPDFRFDGPSPIPYGFGSALTGEEAETGPRVRITALLDSPTGYVTVCTRREVWEKCLRAAAGLSDVAWVPLEVSEVDCAGSARTSGRTSTPARRWRCCAARA